MSREVLTLLLAIKKPSVYLPDGMVSLEVRVDQYLRRLAEAGIIAPALRDAALRVHLTLRQDLRPGTIMFTDRKAVDAVR